MYIGSVSLSQMNVQTNLRVRDAGHWCPPCGTGPFSWWSNGSIHLKVQRFFKRIGSGDSVLSFLGGSHQEFSTSHRT